MRALLGRRRHPFEIVDALRVGDLEILDERLHTLASLRTEMAFDVQLARQLAEVLLDRIDSPLPARTHLLNPGDGALVEFEMQRRELLRQIRRIRIEQLEPEVRAPLLDGHFFHELVQPLEVVGLRDIHCSDFLRGNLRTFEKRFPIERRHELHQRIERLAVVRLFRVSVLHARPVSLRHPRFETHDLIGGDICLRDTGRVQQITDIGAVLIAHALQTRIVSQVVVAVRQREAALVDHTQVLRRILAIDRDVEREWLSDAESLCVTDVACEIGTRANGVDQRKLLLERLQPFRLDTRLIHEACIQIPHLLLIGSLRGIRGCRLFENCAQMPLRAIGQQGECAVVGTISGNVRSLEPRAVHVTIEIVLRTHIRIEVLLQNARAERRRCGRTLRRHRGLLGTAQRETRRRTHHTGNEPTSHRTLRS